MNSDFRGNPFVKFLRSFKYAFHGIIHSVKRERNMRIHLTIGVVVVIFGWVLQLTKYEWLFILLAIFGVIVLELINTAIERVVDLVTQDYHPLAEQAKDVAAGAVLVYAILSVIIGCIIFIPKLF